MPDTDPPPVPARQSATETQFTASFEAVLASVGIEAIRTPVASPRANAFAEPFVRTVREDCLDHLLVVARRHLEVVLADYVRHYNRRGSTRLEQPIRRPAPSVPRGTIVRNASSKASSTKGAGGLPESASETDAMWSEPCPPLGRAQGTRLDL